MRPSSCTINLGRRETLNSLFGLLHVNAHYIKPVPVVPHEYMQSKYIWRVDQPCHSGMRKHQFSREGCCCLQGRLWRARISFILTTVPETNNRQLRVTQFNRHIVYSVCRIITTNIYMINNKEEN